MSSVMDLGWHLVHLLCFPRLTDRCSGLLLFVSLLFSLSSGVYEWRCAVLMVCPSPGPVSEAAEADIWGIIWAQWGAFEFALCYFNMIITLYFSIY